MGNNKRVIAILFGGLGNQLFIYAAAKRLAKKAGAELIIDNISGFKYDIKFNREFQLDHFNIKCRYASYLERLEPFSRIKKYFLRRIKTKRIFNNLVYYKQKGDDFDPSVLNIEVKKNTYLEGYFQSEQYFKDIENEIRDDLIIQPPMDKMNNLLSQKIKENESVAIHIRNFNSNNNSKNAIEASTRYYINSIEFIIKHTLNPHFFIFSDNHVNALKKLKLNKENYTIVDNNQSQEMAYADLWLMSLCKHHIIANSTFSWWGAWLSNYDNGLTIAPKLENKEFDGRWGFDGLIPEKWIQL